jgi:addiction module RelE/StbE family toxin
MIPIIRHTTFKKAFRHAPKQVQEKFLEKMAIFVENQFDETLNNHQLQGKYKGCRSFNITSDIRVIYYVKEGVFILIAMGTHSQLY